MDMMANIAAEGPLLQGWVYWMMIINTASILFVIQRVEARWVLAAWVANLFLMGFLYDTYGYTRILGLSHIVLWTPLLVYLWRRRSEIDGSSWGGRYLWVLFITNFVSLVFDYVDLVRYFMGDQAA
ncbi:MAG: hypothetical protein ACFB0Z_14725 [Candidatus Phaeomarinobacter sp.]